MDYTQLRTILFSLALSLLCFTAASKVVNQPCSWLVNRVRRPPRIDCSGLNLFHMPTNLNGVNATKLDLSHNKMMYLNASDLQTFNALIWLDLSWNHLWYLNNDSFIHVRSTLTYLDLSHNWFPALPDNSFTPLQNVVTLLLAEPGIPRNTAVPPLGPGFRNVTQLRNFSLTGIYIEDFNATFVHNLITTNLTVANFSFNRFNQTKNNTFLRFHALTHLTMRHVSELTEPALRRLMQSLKNSPLEILELGGNDDLASLKTHTFSGLSNAPLDKLEVSFTGVRSIEDYTFRPVGKNLTLLQLDGMQLYSVSLYAFQGLQNIKTLDLEQNLMRDFDRCLNNLTTLQNLMINMNPLQQIGPETFYGLDSLDYLTLSSTRVQHLPNNTFLPLRTLRHLNMSWLENREMTIEPDAFQGFSEMRIFKMNKAGIRNFTADHIRPMIKLEHISLDYNALTGLDSQVFKPVNSTLRVISLIQSNITYEMLEDGLLQDLPYLNTTWLWDNRLHDMPNDTFKGYESLYIIELQDNKLAHIPEAVKLVHTMRILNMYNNSIQKVLHDRYNDLAYLNSSQLYEYMGGSNPYNCSCDVLPFIDWFNETNITTDDRSFYRCDWPKKLKNHDLYKFNRTLCDRHEPPNYLALEIALPATVVVVVALTLGLLYHYRLKIKWLWYLRRLAYYRKLEEEDDQEYEFDALVSYGERGDDYKFVLTKMMPMLEQPEDDVEKLKLAVEFRDIPAGDDKAEVLIEFIEKSRKTVLLISKLSVQNQDDWLWYVYRQAAFRAPGRKNLLIIILLEPDVQKERNLPKPLQQDLKKRLYIAWPGNNASEGEKDLFWKQLREALKDTRNIPMTNMFP